MITLRPLSVVLSGRLTRALGSHILRPCVTGRQMCGLRHLGYTIYLLQENVFLFFVTCLFIVCNLSFYFFVTGKLTCFFIFCKKMYAWDPHQEEAVRQVFHKKGRSILTNALHDLLVHRT